MTEIELAAIRKEYRTSLLKIQDEMQSQYDKTVLALSGGSIGVSITLIKELLGVAAAKNSTLLLLSWLFWGVSISAVLASFFSSALAMEKTINELDRDGTVSENPGGLFNMWTRCLNLLAGLGFFSGLLCFIFFIASRP